MVAVSDAHAHYDNPFAYVRTLLRKTNSSKSSLIFISILQVQNCVSLGVENVYVVISHPVVDVDHYFCAFHMCLDSVNVGYK